MLILRSIPHSLPMLLRLVLTFPIVLIIMIGIYLVITLILIVLGAISPALMSIGVLLSIVPSASGVLLPMLVVMRMTLQARGVTPSGTYGGLFWAAAGYGLLESLFFLVVCVLLLGGLLVATPFTVAALTTLAADETGGGFEQMMTQFSDSGGLLIAFGAAAALSYCAFRAALLPALAGAAIGRDPNGQQHTPLVGLGSGFGSMFMVVLLSLTAYILIVPIMAAFGFTGSLDDFSEMETELGSWFDGGWKILAAIQLLFLWSTGIQAAGATLQYLTDREQEGPEGRPAPPPASIEATDIRALRKSRSQM